MIGVGNFAPFAGQHCETVATGSLLRTAGLELSEPMLFGLGEGLGFVFLNLKTLPLPFVGGRIRPFELTNNLCRNLGLACEARETSSRAQAWRSLEAWLAAGLPVALQLDSYFLEYFTHPVHFAGHCVAVHALDDRDAHVVDTAPQGGCVTTSRRSLEAARFAKGPMAARARSWTIPVGGARPDLAAAVARAIRGNARAYLAPKFGGMSHRGIQKLRDSLPHWATRGRPEDLALAAALMEQAGTGGALFRNFYRDFLHEARALVPRRAAELDEAHAAFAESARRWTRLSSLVAGGATRDAAALCDGIADLEVTAMTVLRAM
jgi:hypothetical protein